MVESTALEMRHTGNRIGGSNPSLSATNQVSDISAVFGSARVRITAHIPGLCGTRTSTTVCTETNFSEIAGICGRASQLRLCGGTAVSCRVSIFLMSELNMRTRDRRGVQASPTRAAPRMLFGAQCREIIVEARGRVIVSRSTSYY